jgi:beta-xylosidase
MICQRLLLFSFCALCLLSANESPAQKAQNPVIFADVPDMSMMRVGDTYYMSSTTMHMAPGVPVMTSKDLINWKITSYCYDILDDVDALNLVNGKSTYGRGTWASSIRYHKGLFYVSTFAQTTNKTYIYTTDDPEKGEWKKTSFAPAYHDHSQGSVSATHPHQNTLSHWQVDYTAR